MGLTCERKWHLITQWDKHQRVRITRFVAAFYYGPLFTKAHRSPRWSWFQSLALPLDAVRPGASYCASLSLVLLVWKTEVVILPGRLPVRCQGDHTHVLYQVHAWPWQVFNN